MVLVVSEHEMLERLVDSLKRSASRVSEYLRADISDRPKIFIDFIDGLKVGAGSAHQLCHSQENPRWLNVRDTLEKIIEVGQELPLMNRVSDNGIWFQIKQSLEQMAETCWKMGTARAMKRQDVLWELDQREKQIPKDVNGN